MTNEYEMTDDNRAGLIYEKDRLLAPPETRHGSATTRAASRHNSGRLLPRRHHSSSRTASTRARAEPGDREMIASVTTTILAEGTMTSTSTGEAVQFWILGTLAVISALGVVAAPPKAVYSALFLAMTMIILAVFYIVQGALFLGVVQIVVYTGAVMMLFLFVLMLVGVDSSDSLVETLRGGQRVSAIVIGVGFGLLLIGGLGNASISGGFTGFTGLDQGNIDALADLIFIRYVWAFELTGALLITATLGAMMLAHREKIGATLSQRELSQQRFAYLAAMRAIPTRARPLPPSPQSRRVRTSQRSGHAGTVARRNVLDALRQQRTHSAFPRIRVPVRSLRDESRELPVSVGPVVHHRAAGVLLRRNAIVVFMCIELMLNAANLAFVTFARMHGNLDGQIFAFFTMVVAAAEVVVGLAIIMIIFRSRRSVSVDDADLLKY